MKQENELELAKVHGTLTATALVLEIKDKSREITEHEVSIKFLREAVSVINKIFEDEKS